MQEQKQSPVVILQQSTFYNILIWCSWLRIITRSDPVVKFMNFPSQIFITILIMATEQLYWIKVLCGCFRFTWLWLLIAIIKTCTERCALQLFRTSLISLEDSTHIKAYTRSSTLIKISKNMVWVVKGSQSLLAQFYMGSFKNIFTRKERTEWNRKKSEKKRQRREGIQPKQWLKIFLCLFFLQLNVCPSISQELLIVL